MFGVKRFHSYLYGHPFTLISDHKPLLSLFNEVKAVPPQASARIQRWALTLATYAYTMAYRQSSDHGNADAMSRLPLPVPNSVPPAPAKVVLLMEGLGSAQVSASCVSREIERDPTLSRVQQFILSGWPEVVRDPELRPYLGTGTLCHNYFPLCYALILTEYTNYALFSHLLCLTSICPAETR